MAIQVATGQASSLDAREAGMLATQQALELLGKKTVSFCIIVASYHFPFQQLLSGITPLLGDTPLLGFSTTAVFSTKGIASHSVTITLISGSDILARSAWWPGFEDEPFDAAQKVIQAFQLHQSQGVMLIAADGLSGIAHRLCSELPTGNYTLAGCLASGDIRRNYTYQIGGKNSGRGGLAAAFLNGNFSIGVGYSHAWKPVGTYFTVTGVNNFKITSLNNQIPDEMYAHFFGYTPQEWTTSPLNELARLYPIGLEQDDTVELQVRSPLQIEADGNMRMNTSVEEGSVAHMMVGGIQDCINAASEATHQALTQLNGAQPRFGLVFADVAVQLLTQAQPGNDLKSISEILGTHVPVIGGYTFGQIVRNQTREPEMLNQHITVIVLGENKPE